jgi:hypothetical protein
MARYGLKINRFDGGLNTKISPELGELNESPDLLNVDFDDLGAVGTRKGRATIGSVGSGEVCLLHSYRRDGGSPDLLAVCSGSVYYARGDSTDFSVCSGGTGIMTAGIQAFAADMQNHCFISNGTLAYKWDGNSMTRWTCPEAPDMPVPGYTSAITSTTLNYQGVSWIRSYTDTFGIESEASSAITGATLLSGCQFIMTAPVASAGVAYVNVYRSLHTSDGGDGLYHLLTTYANTGDATVIDNFGDTLSTAVQYEVTASPAPPRLHVFTEHLGRFFGASLATNPTFLYYTYASEPSQWDPEYYIRVGDGDGFPIRGLLSMGQNLLIAKEDGKGNGSVWVLYTPDNETINWQINRLDLAYGSVSPKAMCRFAGYIMLLNRSGVYDLAEGTVGERISNALSFPIEPNVLTWDVDNLPNSVAVQYDNKIYMSVPTSGQFNDQMWVYDFVKGRSEVTKFTGAWSRWDNQQMSDLCVHNDQLYGGDYAGNVVRFNIPGGYNDSGEAITSYWQSMSIRGIPEHYDNEKVFRYIWVTVECTGNWNLNVTYAENLLSSEGTTQRVDLDPKAATWQDAITGESKYGATRARYTARIPINVSGRTLQVKFWTNTANQHWLIHDCLVEYNLRGIR